MSRFGGVPAEDEPTTGSRFGGVPVEPSTAPVVASNPDDDVFALSDEQILMNQLNKFPPKASGVRNLRLLENVGLLTEGQNREDALALVKRRGLPVAVDPATGQFVVDVSSYVDPEMGALERGERATSIVNAAGGFAMEGAKKGFSTGMLPVKGLLKVLETVYHYTWDVQASGAAATAAKSRVRRQVEWSLANAPDAPLLSAGEYLSMQMDNAVPEAFVMTEPEIDKLGASVFHQEFRSPPESFVDEAFGFVHDMYSTLLGESGDVFDLELHPDEVARMVDEVDAALVDPIETALTKMAYMGVAADMPEDAQELLLPGMLGRGAALPGESAKGTTDRWRIAMNEAIADGNKGSRSFMAVPLMVVTDISTALSWPVDLAAHAGINLSRTGMRIMDDAHAAISTTARARVAEKLATVERTAGARMQILENDAKVIQAEIDALADTPNSAFAVESWHVELDEVNQEREALLQIVTEARRSAAEGQDAASIAAQMEFNRRMIELVDVSHRHDAPLKGDHRTLLAWDKWLDDAAPKGVKLPETPEAFADYRATYIPEAEAAFAAALKEADAAGGTLVGIAEDGSAILSQDAPKRILAINDAARLKAAAATSRYLSRTAFGRKVLGSRSSWFGTEHLQRTLTSMVHGPRSAQPLAGPTATSYWGAYARGEVMHPAMFADLVDGLQRNNRTAAIIADKRRAYIQSLVDVLGDDAYDTLKVLDDGDSGRIIAAAAALRAMDDAARAGGTGESFTLELLAAQAFTKGLNKLRSDLPEIAELVSSPVLADRAEGLARLRAKADIAANAAADAVARKVLAEMAETAKSRGADVTRAQKALKKGDLDAAIELIDGGDDVWLLANEAAERARSRVMRVLESDRKPMTDKARKKIVQNASTRHDASGAEPTLSAWDEWLKKSEAADELLVEINDLRDHSIRLKAEIDAHAANLKSMRLRLRHGQDAADELVDAAENMGGQGVTYGWDQKNIGRSAYSGESETMAHASGRRLDRVATPPESSSVLDAMEEQVVVVKAMLSEAKHALKQAKNDIGVKQKELGRLQRKAAATRPKTGDPAAFVHDYYAQMTREAALNEKEVNGLFARVRHMEEFNDLQPHERTKVVELATGKRPPPKDQPEHIRRNADNLRKMLRRYARELHEHLAEQGVRGASVDDIVANLDLTRLLPNLTKWDGLSKQKALAGEIISPSYLTPGMVDIAGDRLSVRQARAVEDGLKQLWKAEGKTGPIPAEWREATLKREWQNLAPYNHDPIPLISHFLKEADSAIADRHFIADLRARFPMGQRIARTFGWDGELHADAIGYAMVDSGPMVGAHNRVGLPPELKHLEDTIVMNLESGMTSAEVFNKFVGENPVLAKPELMAYIKGAEHALETPLYLPKPVAEFVNWFYKDGAAPRKKLEESVSGRNVARTVFEPTTGDAVAAAYDGVHAWAKQQLTTWRSPVGYTSTNIVGNLMSGVQVNPEAMLSPTNHLIASSVVAGLKPDAEIRIGARTMTMRDLEMQMLEDNIHSTGRSEAFRREQGLVQAGSSSKRDVRLYDDRPIKSTGMASGSRDVSPAVDLLERDTLRGGLWNAFARAVTESVPVSEIVGFAGDIKAGIRDKDARAVLERAAKASWSDAGKKLAGAATRASGAFAGSLLGAPMGASPGVSGLLGAIGAPGWARITSEMNSAVEDQFRATLYIGALRQGATREQAVRQVERAARNYDEISPFERRVLKRMFGFYTWDAGNIRLQTQWAARNPGPWATIATALDIYHRGQFSDEEMAQLPQGARHRVLLNMGAGKILAMMDLPQTGVLESVERKVALARAVAPGFITANERADAVGQLSAPIQALQYIGGVTARGERLERGAYVGNKAGWDESDLDLLPPYLRDVVLQLKTSRPLRPVDGERKLGIETDNPRALARLQATPLNSILSAYWRVVIPPEDPALHPEWEQSMVDRMLLVMTGMNLYPVTADAEKIQQVRERDLYRLLRELEPVAPWDERLKFPQMRVVKEQAEDDSE